MANRGRKAIQAYPELLTTFLCVARLDMASAASDLGISAHSVRKRIDQLESHLGHRLFRPRGSHLTALGKKVFQACEAAEAAYRRSWEEIDRSAVSVVASPTGVRHWVPLALSLYDGKSAVVVRQAPTDQIVGLVADQVADFGLGRMPSPEHMPSGLRFAPYQGTPTVVALPKKCELKSLLKMNQELGWLVSAESTHSRKRLKDLLSGAEPVVRYELPTYDAVVAAVAHGLGAALCPEHHVFGSLTSGSGGPLHPQVKVLYPIRGSTGKIQVFSERPKRNATGHDPFVFNGCIICRLDLKLDGDLANFSKALKDACRASDRWHSRGE